MKLTKNNWIRVLGWLMVLTIILLSLLRWPEIPTSVPSSDKLLHFLSYFILTYWFFHAYPRPTKLIMTGFIILGCLLEYLQSLTGYRFMEWLDMFMNVTGVLVAYLVFYNFEFKLDYLMVQNLTTKKEFD